MLKKDKTQDTKDQIKEKVAHAAQELYKAKKACLKAEQDMAIIHNSFKPIEEKLDVQEVLLSCQQDVVKAEKDLFFFANELNYV